MEDEMADIVAQMTKDELKELIETTIEQNLFELFGDPEEGLEIKEEIRDQLRRQMAAVEAGERGEALEDVVNSLSLS
jgi:sialic acid synthase SpsE